MRKVILTIAIVLCAASAFADDHRGERGDHDNGDHYGKHWKHDSHTKHECRAEREWRPRYVEYRPEYREVRVLPTRYVTYSPDYRYEQPRVAVSLPSFPLSLFVAFR
jgi:hypothetical protein